MASKAIERLPGPQIAALTDAEKNVLAALAKAKDFSQPRQTPNKA
jgi:hypothetical protein